MARRRSMDEDTRYAHREIGRVHRGLATLRGLLVVDATLLGLIVIPTFIFGEPGPITLALAAIFVAAVVGAVLVVRNPYPWTLGLAIGHTLLALLMWLAPGFSAIVASLIAALLWWAVSVAANARNLKRAFPDAWAENSRTYTGLSEDAVGSKFRDRAKQERAAKRKQMLLYVVLPIVVLIVGVIVMANMRDDEPTYPTAPKVEKPTKPLGPRAEALRAAWNTSDFDQVRELIAPSERDKLERLVRKVIRRRKWKDDWPHAGAPLLERYDDTRRYAHHELVGYGALKVSWVWEDGNWWCVRLGFKKD